MRLPRRASLVLPFALALWAPNAASATYSIVAVDLGSRAVGGAGTSCVGANLSVSDIYRSAPGYGAVMAQASINRDARDRAVELLAGGEGALAIIAEISDVAFDSRRASRQYAVVDLQGDAAGFTGTSALAFADDRQGRAGDFVYSVQGNILTSAAVLEQAAGAFELQGCDLADRLMRALEAGAANGQGDSRCTPDGIPSDGAFIEVDLPTGPAGSFLRLRVDDTAPMSPIVALRAQYDAWRATHVCPAPMPAMPDAGMAGASAGGQDAGLDAGVPPRAGAGAGGMDGSAMSAGAGGSTGGALAGAGGAAGRSSGGAPSIIGVAGSVAAPVAGAAAPVSARSTGCGVATEDDVGAPLWLLSLLALRRRRARVRARVTAN